MSSRPRPDERLAGLRERAGVPVITNGSPISGRQVVVSEVAHRARHRRLLRHPPSPLAGG